MYPKPVDEIEDKEAVIERFAKLRAELDYLHQIKGRIRAKFPLDVGRLQTEKRDALISYQGFEVRWKREHRTTDAVQERKKIELYERIDELKEHVEEYFKSYHAATKPLESVDEEDDTEEEEKKVANLNKLLSLTPDLLAKKYKKKLKNDWSKETITIEYLKRELPPIDDGNENNNNNIKRKKNSPIDNDDNNNNIRKKKKKKKKKKKFSDDNEQLKL